MNWFAKLVEALKESPKLALAFALASGIILAFPKLFIARDLPETLKPYVGAVFLLSATVLLASLIWHLGTHWMAHRARVKILNGLTPQERDLLRRYVEGETKTLNVPSPDPIVIGLKKQGLLSQPVSIIVSGGAAPKPTIVLEAWAYDYLKTHPKLIAPPNA